MNEWKTLRVENVEDFCVITPMQDDVPQTVLVDHYFPSFAKDLTTFVTENKKLQVLLFLGYVQIMNFSFVRRLQRLKRQLGIEMRICGKPEFMQQLIPQGNARTRRRRLRPR